MCETAPAKRPRTGTNSSIAHTVLSILELQRLVAGGLRTGELREMRLVCKALQHVLAAWPKVDLSLTQFGYAHKPSIKTLDLWVEPEEAQMVSLAASCPAVEHLIAWASHLQVTSGCLAFARLKTLELVLCSNSLDTLGTIEVEWELETLMLRVHGEDEFHSLERGQERGQRRRNNINAFLLSLLTAPSLFHTLRNFILKEDLRSDYYAENELQSDQDVLVALSALSHSRKLGTVEVPLRPFAFPSLWTSVLKLFCMPDWATKCSMDEWLAQVKTNTLVFGGCVHSFTLAGAPVLAIPEVSELHVWPLHTPRNARKFDFRDFSHQRPWPSLVGEARVPFDRCGLSFGVVPGLVSLDVARTVLSTRSATAIVEACPNLRDLSIGAHCFCWVVDREHALPKLVEGLTHLDKITITNYVHLVAFAACTTNCHYLPMILEGCSAWNWNSVRVVAARNFNREVSGFDEAQTLIPPWIQLNLDFELVQAV